MVSFAVLFSKSSISRSPSYYRLYDNDSEAISKSSFGEYDSFLGRIDTFTIPPPHTVASPEYCLVSGHDVQLLENEITTNDSDAIVPLTGDFPDSKEDQPIVFVYARKTFDSTTKAAESSSFSKRLTVNTNWGE